jgi:hypothetical protein
MNCFLKTNLSEHHPIFKSRIFTSSIIDDLRGETLTGIGRCSYTDKSATGISPHLALSEQLHKLQERQDYIEKKIESLQKDLPVEVATKVTEELQENFVIEGVSCDKGVRERDPHN